MQGSPAAGARSCAHRRAATGAPDPSLCICVCLIIALVWHAGQLGQERSLGSHHSVLRL